MNFKILLVLIFCVSCGIKGDPSAPQGQPLPSALDNFSDIKTQQPLNDGKIKK